MYEHSDCMLCSIGGVGGVTAGCSPPGDMTAVGTAGSGLEPPKTLGGGGVNVGGTAGALNGMPNTLGGEGVAPLGLSLGFENPKKLAGGSVKTDGVGVWGDAPKMLGGGDGVEVGAGAPKMLGGGGGVEGSRGFGGSVNAGGKGGGAAIGDALALLPKRPGGGSASTSCFTGGTHVPNCGLGEAGCGTIAGGADSSYSVVPFTLLDEYGYLTGCHLFY